MFDWLKNITCITWWFIETENTDTFSWLANQNPEKEILTNQTVCIFVWSRDYDSTFYPFILYIDNRLTKEKFLYSYFCSYYIMIIYFIYSNPIFNSPVKYQLNETIVKGSNKTGTPFTFYPSLFF